jgi:hypothetical protein
MDGRGEELVDEKVVQGRILFEGRLDVPQESGPERALSFIIKYFYKLLKYLRT